VLGFFATEYLTPPFPAPVAPDVIVIHEGSLLVAVQAHPFCVDTLTVAFPPETLKVLLVGDIE